MAKYAFYGSNIAEYLAGNADFQLFLARNPPYNDKFVKSGQIAPGTLDLEWIPVQNAFFAKDDGVIPDDASVNTIFGPDAVIICPEPSEWWTVMEGSYPVPKSLMIAQDVEQMLNNFEIKYGEFGFALLNPPSQIIGCYGDTQLPRMKVPEAVCICDTTP